jgi:hypothetical protein
MTASRPPPIIKYATEAVNNRQTIIRPERQFVNEAVNASFLEIPQFAQLAPA